MGDADNPAEAAAAAAAGVPRRKNRGNVRKRAASDDDAGDAAEAAAAAAARARAARPGAAPLAFSTARAAKAEAFRFEAAGTLQQRGDGGATRGFEGEAAGGGAGGGAPAPAAAPPPPGAAAPLDGGEYRGAAAYTDFRAGFRQEPGAGAAHGPLKGSTNVRMTVRVDYQPDVCKDYKETGYCGFGDACKFLHDRGDYKAGYELDAEWEAKQAAQRERLLAGWQPEGDEAGGEGGGGGGGGGDDDDDGVPFACLLCRRPWAEARDPVVTRCRHYFCEQCALRHNARSKRCAECDAPTGGTFNVAHDVLRREARRRAAEGGGGGGGDAGEGAGGDAGGGDAGGWEAAE